MTQEERPDYPVGAFASEPNRLRGPVAARTPAEKLSRILRIDISLINTRGAV